MLEVPRENIIEVIPDPVGYMIRAKSPLKDNRSMVIVQVLSTGTLIVGKTENQEFFVYKRPLEATYDHMFEGHFKVLLVHDNVDDTGRMADLEGTKYARPLINFPLPFAYRLSSLPIYFDIQEGHPHGSLRMFCVDPGITKFRLVFVEEDPNTKAINTLSSYFVLQLPYTLDLYHRRHDCKNRKIILNVFDAEQQDANIVLGMAVIPNHRTFSKQVYFRSDYYDQTVDLDDFDDALSSDNSDASDGNSKDNSDDNKSQSDQEDERKEDEPSTDFKF